MARSVQEPTDEAPPIDPEAVDRAYRRHRAQRRARSERSRATKRAGRRFWFVLLVLLVGSVAIAAAAWQEIQRLFGL